MKWNKSDTYALPRYDCGEYSIREGTNRVRRGAGWGHRKGTRTVRIWNILCFGKIISRNVTSLAKAKTVAEQHRSADMRGNC
jgi:hypothetical protein